jgi:geranylgeranyl pyrophosphate synthase
VALIRELSRAAGYRGMVGGQVADIRATPEITEDALSRLHACKTGALIRAAAVMGGVVAGAVEVESRALEQYGTAIGMAFQLADDLLDSEEDAADDGPPSYVKLVGFEETQRRAHFFSQQAIDAVLHLPDPEVLVALAQFTVRRRE